MIRIDDALSTQGLKSKMALTVPDELVFEVPLEELEVIKSHTKDIMENIWKFNVPLKVNVAVGADWAEAH
jgi:DNA polymerase I